MFTLQTGKAIRPLQWPISVELASQPCGLCREPGDFPQTYPLLSCWLLMSRHGGNPPQPPSQGLPGTGAGGRPCGAFLPLSPCPELGKSPSHALFATAGKQRSQCEGNPLIRSPAGVSLVQREGRKPPLGHFSLPPIPFQPRAGVPSLASWAAGVGREGMHPHLAPDLRLGCACHGAGVVGNLAVGALLPAPELGARPITQPYPLWTPARLCPVQAGGKPTVGASLPTPELEAGS